MKRKLTAICGAVLIGSLPTIGAAGIIIEMRQLDDPAPGLQAFMVSAVGTEGGIVGSIASLQITDVHQVWENAIAGSNASTPKATDLEGTFWNSSWNVLDTHFLLDPNTMITSPQYGITETNDGSNPADLSLPGPAPFDTFAGVSGMGDLHFTGVAPQVTFIGDSAPTSVDFLRVVVPENTFASLSVRFVDRSVGQWVDHEGVLVGIPEPAGLSLLGLVALPLLRRQRRLQ